MTISRAVKKSSLTLYLVILISSSLLSLRPSFAETESGCFDGLLRSIAAAKGHIESKYDLFKAYSDHASASYSALSAAEQKTLTNVPFFAGEDTAAMMQEKITLHIRSSADLNPAEKQTLIVKLGLDNRNPAQAIENFRQNYEYMFWTDHSQVHMKDILGKSKINQVLWPKDFVKPYREVLRSKLWDQRIDWAIRLHDSNMVQSRALHAELLLLADDAAFPIGFDQSEKMMTSVISMLHSKTLMPYSQLENWSKILEEKIIPRLVKDRVMSSQRSSELVQWIHGLSREEREGIVKAASWIRMNDVDRPIGFALKNSSGDFFSKNLQDDEIFILRGAKKIPIAQSQYRHIYGQLALENIKILPSPSGFTASFKLTLKGEEAEKVSSELNRLPFLNWIAEGTAKAHMESYSSRPNFQSILYNLNSILDDFPPHSFNAVEITH